MQEFKLLVVKLGMFVTKCEGLGIMGKTRDLNVEDCYGIENLGYKYIQG